jgi:hypothetical protein
VASTVPHELVDREGRLLRVCAFAPGVRWLPGEVIVSGPGRRFLVVERVEGSPVRLVVERL